MDILYCIDTGTIILSPKTLSQIPQLAGLLLQKVNGSYLNGISRFYFPILSEVPKRYIIKDLESYLSKKPDQIFIINEDTQEEISIDSFRIEENNEAYKFPLNIHLSSTVFYGQGTFSKYTPEFYEREYDEGDNYDDYSESDAFYDATDGQLGDMGDFGWTYLGRD